jgi:large subunit ribosomal protein L23
MKSPDAILKEYRITEKATALTSNANQYTFEVHPNANRIEVKKAIEKVFGKKVVKVNIINQTGKMKRARNMRGAAGRTPHIKKAIITLAQGETIEMA